MASAELAPMTPAEALRRFEERLIPEQLVAAQDSAFELYAEENLPNPDDQIDSYAERTRKRNTLIRQGYEAGYARAMQKVRAMLMETQGEVNADARATSARARPPQGPAIR